MEDETRKGCLYRPGEWEKGGWFVACKADTRRAGTKPDEEKMVEGKAGPASVPGRGEDPFDDPISREQERLDSLGTDAVSAESKPDQPGDSGDVEKAVLDEAKA